MTEKTLETGKGICTIHKGQTFTKYCLCCDVPICKKCEELGPHNTSVSPILPKCNTSFLFKRYFTISSENPCPKQEIGNPAKFKQKEYRENLSITLHTTKFLI